ncbi:HEAT repeat domain-containing protein [Chondromyces crocatus]|uniref:HEAT repeat domain-containing protein n=1 Tax=Chondromyces crocatus TaxID=52 RepID=UPI0014700FE5|nr:HEAT repeat domain-containing protein [Chondromyces crocatus]
MSGEFIKSLLQDEDARNRVLVMDGLGECAEPEVLEHLLDVISRDPSEDVREAALRGLEGRATLDVLDTLLDEVRRQKRSRPPRQIVARLLGEHDDDRALDALVELVDDDDVYVQQPAIESLAHLNRPRLEALWVLIARSWEGTKWAELAQWALEDLRQRPERQDAASLALVEHRTSIALHDLAHEEPNVRRSAVRRLAFYRPSNLVDLLLGVLGDSNEHVRAVAISALANVGDERARMPIVNSMQHDPSDVVCAAAAQALASFPSKDVLRALKEAVAGRLSGSPHALASAALALGEYEDDEAVDGLVELSRNPSPIVRNTAADVLLSLNRSRQRSA